MMPARALAQRWADSLAAWAIPEDILARAPESPWGFPTEIFARSAREAVSGAEGSSPSRTSALQALSGGGTVLDVGAGGGAASLPLAPPATRIIAVDESGAMLDAFRGIADARSIAYNVVEGTWPDIARRVEVADVAVCHHVLYNVADILPFLEELHSHARRRVVIEITGAHPQADLSPLWRELHGIERPETPVADDVVDLLRASGRHVDVERFWRPSRWAHIDRAAQVAFARRRLCLPADRDAEIDRLLTPTDREIYTLWWDPMTDTSDSSNSRTS